MPTGTIVNIDNRGLLIQCDGNKYLAPMTKEDKAKFKGTKRVTFDVVKDEKGKDIAVNVNIAPEQPVAPQTQPQQSPPRRNHNRSGFKQEHRREQSASDTLYSPPPYHFVAIPVVSVGEEKKLLSITGEPVFHDGLQAKNGDLFSGELHCTLTALTPLLAGNFQYEVYKEDKVKVKGAKETAEGIQLPANWGINAPVVKDKHIIEPLRLNDKEGRVLISGRALKGMLRHSLSALLSAPMERVAEHTYSYRPNLNFAEDEIKHNFLPAIVDSVKNNQEDINIRILDKPNDVIFITPFAYKNYIKGLGISSGGLIKSTVNDVVMNSKRRSGILYKYLEERQGHTSIIDHYLFLYKGGIDGTGELARTNPKAKKWVYDHVLVEKTIWEAVITKKSISISKSVIEQYKRTVDHLCDTASGHLRPDYPHIKNNEEGRKRKDKIVRLIKDNSKFSPNQLIYVEADVDDQGNPVNIVSIGHHFRYRWKHAGSVRYKANGDQRKILKPLPEEIINIEPEEKHIKPEKLSGARLLFGYVSGKDNEGTKGIGKGNYSKLSGRIAFNIAVEHTNGKDLNARFLNADTACIVPLKILGQPRASAAELYLQQHNGDHARRNDGGTMVTYGDLLKDDPAGELNGRKFYLHQPDAANAPDCYSPREMDDTVTGNQAALARFVSKPGSEFRFTVRFRNLREWELGALLFALDPEGASNELATALSDWHNVKRYVAGVHATGESTPRFALKLGHGRPLGLGSVRIKIDAMHTLNPECALTDSSSLKDRVIKEFASKLKEEHKREEVLLQWLKVHRYAGRTSYKYPRSPKDGEIFTFHSEIRQAHAKGRRGRSKKARPDDRVLKALDEGVIT